jgi:hypothetical protein
MEVELDSSATQALLKETDKERRDILCRSLSRDLWFILSELNPLSNVLDVDSCLRDHTDKQQAELALAQCGALKRFIDGGKEARSYQSPILSNRLPPPALGNLEKFIGCLPVNFRRQHMEEVQRPSPGYVLSEMTDGVRHLLVFTRSTAVLINRDNKTKQPVRSRSSSSAGGEEEDPFAYLMGSIEPGTVLDGEVVMNR